MMEGSINFISKKLDILPQSFCVLKCIVLFQSTITHRVGLGHETMVCAVCLSIFLWGYINAHITNVGFIFRLGKYCVNKIMVFGWEFILNWLVGTMLLTFQIRKWCVRIAYPLTRQWSVQEYQAVLQRHKCIFLKINRFFESPVYICDVNAIAID